jgi:hypothetical protein
LCTAYYSGKYFLNTTFIIIIVSTIIIILQW